LTISPSSLDELRPSYQLASGDISIDLGDLDFGGEAVELDLDSGVGNIYVYVPAGVAIEASANATLGEVGVGGSRSSGLGAEVIRSIDGEAGRLIIDADVRIGSIEVYYTDFVGFDGPLNADDGIVPLTGDNRLVQVLEGIALVEPQTVGEIAGTYEILDGRLILDLTGLDEPGVVVPISFVGYGEVSILVPNDAHLIATGDVPFADVDGTTTGAGWWERPGSGITLIINAAGPSVSIEE
jgi:hypothetical protein